jgi:hypothetical protein
MKLLYWWVKMIDCLLINLFITTIVKIYIIISIIQCSFIIEMKTIFIYSYCMWNILLIRSIKWYRERSFQKQACTMINNACSRAHMIIINLFKSIKSLIIKLVWKWFIASQLHYYDAISVSFINLFNHTSNEKIFDSIANWAICRDKICICRILIDWRKNESLIFVCLI